MSEFDGIVVDGLVQVIPVRMSESWLLCDAQAIAKAADSPSANVKIPKLKQIEQMAQPKDCLETLLFEAAGSPTGRRGKMFKNSLARRRVNLASLIVDYSPLESLDAFVEFQKSLATAYPYRVQSGAG